MKADWRVKVSPGVTMKRPKKGGRIFTQNQLTRLKGPSTSHLLSLEGAGEAEILGRIGLKKSGILVFIGGKLGSGELRS